MWQKLVRPGILIILVATFAALNPVPANAAPPTLAWIRQSGGIGNDAALGVATDRLGNAYVVGYIKTGGGTAASDDAFVRKYDSDGNLTWEDAFNTGGSDYAKAIAVDSAFNAYVAGWTDGTLPSQISSGGVDAYVRKYDDSGNIVWTRQFGTSASDQAVGIDLDSAGNPCVVGHTGGDLAAPNSGGDDVFARLYDGSGNVLATVQFGTDMDDKASGISIGSLGNLYISGWTGGTLPGQTKSLVDDAFVRKYSPSLTEEWTQQFGLGLFPHAFAFGVATAGFEDVYVVGNLGGRVIFYDAFIRKYDRIGVEQWTRELTARNLNAVAASGSRIYVAGTAPDSEAFLRDVFVARYDTTGSEAWNFQLGTDADEEANAVAAHEGTTIYVAGFATGPLADQEHKGGSDAFLMKLTEPRGRPEPSPSPIPITVPGIGLAGTVVLISLLGFGICWTLARRRPLFRKAR